MQLHTPQDVLKYSHDNNLEGLMLHIAFNNRRGYSFMPIEVKDAIERDGRYYVQTDLLGNGDIEELEVELPQGATDFINGIKEKRIRLAIAGHARDNTEYVLIVVDEPEINTHDKNIDDAMIDSIILDMAEFMDIKTNGAIKTLTQEAEEEYDKWQNSIAIPQSKGANI